jgi:hypothetical protein
MATQSYAILDEGKVINVILLDDKDEYTPAEDQTILLAPDNVAIGWRRDDNTWIAPLAPDVVPEPTEDPDEVAAVYDAVQELTGIGISESTARRILGLPQIG